MTQHYCTTSVAVPFGRFATVLVRILRCGDRSAGLRWLLLLAGYLLLASYPVLAGGQVQAAEPEAGFFAAQGCFAGEATTTSVLLQTRLTAIPGPQLDGDGDVPGRAGLVRFQWSDRDLLELDDESQIRTGDWLPATASSDFIVRQRLDDLQPDTRYYYRAQFSPYPGQPWQDVGIRNGVVGSFRTLGGAEKSDTLTFCMGSCMNYYAFMSGKPNGGGPVTATDEDKRLGYPVFRHLHEECPDFFIGTGDIVYYDHPGKSPARERSELLKKWHEQFRFPRLVEFFSRTTSFWSKDDHDFRFNDADLKNRQLPTAETGIDLFRLQMPIVPSGNKTAPTYRTRRPHRDLQLWFLEGRDYRSPNRMDDGPEKSIWGTAQKAWLQETLRSSDAKWKILISPTPMVGPDRASKRDNHTNPRGFRHEGEAFMRWLNDEGIEGVIIFCGDRHWQYHSIHPSGLEEFCCGALNDENAIRGTYPGDKGSNDPEAKIEQPYHYGKPSGGYLKAVVTGDGKLAVELKDDEGKVGYRIEMER